MKKIFLLSLFLISSHCLAAALTPQAELKNNLQTFRSFKANFNKVVTDSKKRVVERASGQLYLRQPNQFRWLITKPGQQIIVGDGKQIFNYDVGLKQVTVKSFPRTRGELPALILSGYDESIINNYQIERSKGAFRLDAKRNSAVFRRLYLWFSNKRLTRMTLFDHLGYMTDIRFSNVEINPSLNSSLFRFSPPRGVDVVRS